MKIGNHIYRLKPQVKDALFIIANIILMVIIIKYGLAHDLFLEV